MKCHHGIRAAYCGLCASPEAKVMAVARPPLTKVNRFSVRDGMAVKTAPAHENQAPLSATSQRWDKVSARPTKNTPKAHDWRDVVDRACFKFVKNTRAK
jgi:hypothetical protein